MNDLVGKWISYERNQPIGNKWRWITYPARVRAVTYTPAEGWLLLVEDGGRLLSKGYREVAVIDDRRLDELVRNDKRREKRRRAR